MIGQVSAGRHVFHFRRNIKSNSEIATSTRGSRVKVCIVQRIGWRESYFSVLRRVSHILIYTRTRAVVYDWLEDVLRLVGSSIKMKEPKLD